MHGHNVCTLDKTNGIHSEKNMLLDIEPIVEVRCTFHI